jgi:hypothetical protein
MSTHDAWYDAVGRLFVPAPGDISGECGACGERRDDLLRTKRIICARCAAMGAKKYKLDGGRAGPSENQAFLIRDSDAIYAGPIAPPVAAVPGTRFVPDHGYREFLPRILMEPPAPPFFLAVLSLDSDPVLGRTRVTHDLRRMHIGGVVPSVVNQPKIRRWVQAFVAASRPPLAVLSAARLQSALARGPVPDVHRWRRAAADLECLTAESPSLKDLLTPDGCWEVRPGDEEWPYVALVIRALSAPAQQRDAA